MKGITPEALGKVTSQIILSQIICDITFGFKERKCKKGITPVVATILLLMITISITGVSFVFVQRSVQASAQSAVRPDSERLLNRRR